MYFDNFKSSALFHPPPAILRGSAKINVLMHLFRNKRPFLYLKPLKWGWVMKRMNEVVKEKVIICISWHLISFHELQGSFFLPYVLTFAKRLVLVFRKWDSTMFLQSLEVLFLRKFSVPHKSFKRPSVFFYFPIQPFQDAESL